MSGKGITYVKIGIGLAILALIGTVGVRQLRPLHRAISASEVVEAKLYGYKEKVGPVDKQQIVEWFNQGKDPRRSPGNVGHTTTAGVLILHLQSGKRIRLWPEGTDFLVEQDGNYYYLRQPDLKALLEKLDGR